MRHVPLLCVLTDDPVLERAFTWLCHRRPPLSGPMRTSGRSGSTGWRGSHACKPTCAPDGFASVCSVVSPIPTANRSMSGPPAMPCAQGAHLAVGRAVATLRRCTHLKGHGGSKGAVRAVRKHVPRHRFVCRTDVASYYASIDHGLLLDRLVRFVPERGILNLMGQYLTRTAEWGGALLRGASGHLPRLSSQSADWRLLSPRAGHQMQAVGVFYVRFMDDVLVLASTRSKLRHATQVVNRVLSGLRLAKHPDKTFIGRIAKGFDFLGYHFSPTGLKVAAPTVARFVARVHRLYEQEQREPDGPRLLGAYVRRWRGWARGGIYPERDAPEERTDRGPWALTFAYGQGTR